MRENSSLGLTVDDDNEGIPSMLQIASEARKVLRRIKKHAETCQCCKEVLESE